MSLDQFSDDDFLKWLEETVKFFRTSRLDMKGTALVVSNIIIAIKMTKPHIDNSQIQILFSSFQDNIDVEFSKKGAYEKKILKKLQGQVGICLGRYVQEMQNAFETSERYERVGQRMHSSHNVEILKHVVNREPKTPVESDELAQEQLFVGLSYAYASLVNGVFRFTLQDCITWEKVSNGETAEPREIANMEIHSIYEYFKQKNDLLYFEGFIPVVRNAVAHSNFQYDSSAQTMNYVDETIKKDPNTGVESVRRRTANFDYDQMVENYHKIEKIYDLIMIFNKVLLVSTCCSKLCERNP